MVCNFGHLSIFPSFKITIEKQILQNVFLICFYVPSDLIKLLVIPLKKYFYLALDIIFYFVQLRIRLISRNSPKLTS